MFMSCNVCISSFKLLVCSLIEQMFNSMIFIVLWLSFKCLLTYMHVLAWDDESLTRWKKLWVELNVCKMLMLQSCFWMTIMSNLRTFLSIRNDFWIFNDFLMLYYRICRKIWFIIKLSVTVVDSVQRQLFVYF